MDEVGRLRAERDLLLTLLEHRDGDPEVLLRGALGTIVALVGAERGYVELEDEQDPWWHAEGFDARQREMVRASLSSGILAEAMAHGRTVVTQSALFDLRFQERPSVRSNRIRAVLCAPIGRRGEHGAIYLQGAADGDGFDAEHERLASTMARLLGEVAEQARGRQRARQQQDVAGAYRVGLQADELVGRGPAFARVLQGLQLAAPNDVTVLLTGPTGTGKSSVARALHRSGPRSQGEFVALNCAALPDGLVESLLFGAEKGAHSTATTRQTGSVEAARGGTLFLDEIGELPLVSQGKLLELLDHGMYRPLGASRAERADCRIVAATNVDLEAAVDAGRFRRDLYYRLSVLTIELPSLRERPEDIPALAAAACDAAAKRHKLSVRAPSPGAIAAVLEEDWPGNIRQLAHAMEAACIRASGEGAAFVEARHLFPGGPSARGVTETAADETWQASLRRFKRQRLQQVLDEVAWNKSEAARRLDLTRQHIHELIEALGVG